MLKLKDFEREIKATYPKLLELSMVLCASEANAKKLFVDAHMRFVTKEKSFILLESAAELRSFFFERMLQEMLDLVDFDTQSYVETQILHPEYNSFYQLSGKEKIILYLSIVDKIETQEIQKALFLSFSEVTQALYFAQESLVEDGSSAQFEELVKELIPNLKKVQIDFTKEANAISKINRETLFIKKGLFTRLKRAIEL